MSDRLGPRKRWDTVRLALNGALLGMFVAIVEQFCHAFCPASLRHVPAGSLLKHVLTEFVIGAFAGAALFAAVAMVRNWLMRDR
jgi:hypothetical protein